MNTPNLTITDKILAKSILKLIPDWVSPNSITWVRFISVPFVGYFLWIENFAIAFPLFLLSAFTDAIDGSIARTRNRITDFGKLFDPLADKLLISAAALILIPRYLDWSIVLIIVTIELFLMISAYMQKKYYGRIIQAENAGKLKMVLQSFGMGSLLIYAVWNITIFLVIAQYLFYGAILFALISLVVYRAI